MYGSKSFAVISNELPPCCADFFRSIEPTTSVLTRLNYAYDLRLFFEYISVQKEGSFSTLSIHEYRDSMLQEIKTMDIERFLEHLNLYVDEDGRTRENGNAGKARKVSSLKSFFKYLYRSDRIGENIMEKIEMPKVHEKGDHTPLSRMRWQTCWTLWKTARISQRHRRGITKRQKQGDVALLTLLLGTGIRVSELVGLDMNNFDFSANSFLVTRKGGARVVLYFGFEVEKAVRDYVQERKRMTPLEGT